MNSFVLAIDGPAGAGKSATARGVARRLGLLHVDSGAMYRAAAWVALRKGANLDSESEVLHAIESARFEASGEGLRVDGILVEAEIRTADAGEAASRVAVHRSLRRRLVAIQRSLARPPGIVMEGRDIGTNVFPETDFKFYLDANLQDRAKRREADGVTEDLAARDSQDLSLIHI